LINIGEIYLVVNISKEKEASSIKIKLFGGTVQGRTIYFTSDSIVDTTLLIGRINSCQIHVQDQLLSKIHANIQFSRSRG